VKLKKYRLDKWLLITAGLGSQEFEASAMRVANSAKFFTIINKVVALDTEATVKLCREVANSYPSEFSSNTRGFGFMAWKAEVVHKAIHGEYGDYDGVIWVDGGCEMFPSSWTEKKLIRILQTAEKTGLYAFTLQTPEFQYTKKFLLDKYKEVDDIYHSEQIQTTWFALHGTRGREIASKWLDRTLEDFRNLDVSESPGGENPGFIENRYDQSIFSLVCKKMNCSPSANFNVSGTYGALSQLRAYRYPIWASRNRTGISIIPSIIFKVGVFSLRLKRLFVQ
jgi:hypothetical protein